ncbi:DNA-binding protein BIN4 [Cynara cardunculus var. scolymus]|uniref:DNA-binding protein BIN4 n=1 Tax=Cynara cardunculus var. scolymus TaxID=59895 RepID=UPI000D62DE8E|nr:DNA-binding protein BIN4 [Cynara cardunculus var. scolymus]
MSSSSREYSPDWLRNLQAPPTTSILTLSSSSESIPGVSEDEKDDQLPISSVIKKTSQVKSPNKKLNTKRNSLSENEASKRNTRFAVGKAPEKATKPQESKSSVWTLSSDSEHELSEPETGQHPKEEDKDDDVLDNVEESSLKGVSTVKSPKKRLRLEDMVPTDTKGTSLTKQENDGNIKVLERETTEKQTGPYISSSRLPLVLADKVQRSKALVECEGESIDLSGDLGSVGRVVISDSPSGNQDIFLDLKGTIYKTTIIPSRTFCVVSFGQSEAKIEAIMNDFIQLKPQSNVYEAETMVEGTLEGFSFNSEDEADNDTIRQTEDNEGSEPHTNGKGRGKAEKISGSARKKGKTAVKKPAKKVKRKAPAAKKTKTKK